MSQYFVCLVLAEHDIDVATDNHATEGRASLRKRHEVINDVMVAWLNKSDVSRVRVTSSRASRRAQRFSHFS